MRASACPGRRAITAIHQIEGSRNLLRSKLKTSARDITPPRRKNLPASATAFPVDALAKSARTCDN